MAFFNEEKRKRIQRESLGSGSLVRFSFLPQHSSSLLSPPLSCSSSLLSSRFSIPILFSLFAHAVRRKWNVESRWHDDGRQAMGKNVHTINLNLIQIAFCHHYKAKNRSFLTHSLACFNHPNPSLSCHT